MTRAMKESRIPFAPQIPETWREIPNRFLFLEHSSKVGERWNEYQLLSLTTNGVKEKSINDTGGKIPESYNNYQTVEKGDMVFCLFDLDCSAVFSGLSTLDGMITSAYDVFRTNEEYLDNSFARFWFDYVFSRRYYKMFSKNIRYTITADVFKSIYTPCPPIAEQKRIGAFLDKKCGEIDEIVSLQEKIVEELKAYKQSVITEAVCKGLNPDVPMKDSGIEWIEQVPENWNVWRLKFIIASIDSGTSVNAEQNPAIGEEYGVLKTSSVSKNYFDVKENKKVDIEEYTRVSCPVKADTVIVSRMNTPDLVGAAGYCSETISTIFLPDRLWQVSFNKDVSVPKFIWYYLICTHTKNYYSSLSTGTSSSMQNISQPQFENAYVVLPSIIEQQAIADYLDTKCTEIDTLISLKQSKIDALKEYKKSIIYEYITGKKEING